MKGWLIVNGFLITPKFNELYHMFQESARRYLVDLELVRNDQVLADISNKELKFLSKERENPDFILFWDKDIKLAMYLERLGYQVFNSSRSIELCDDKSLTHLALMNERVPMPRTILPPMTYSTVGYTNYSFLEKVKNSLSFPLVLKEVFGSFGKQVYLVKDEKELESMVRERKDTPLLFQEYIKSSKGKDIRLQVVGNEVVAAMYRYNDSGDFRANLSNGGKMKSYLPTLKEKELAIKCCRILGLDFAGVDLLFGEKEEPIVCEVNSNAHFKNITTITGINISDHIIKHIVKCIG